MGNEFYNGKLLDEIKFNVLYLHKFTPSLLFTHILHSHPFVEIFYVAKGEGYFIERENKVLIKEGELIVVNPYNEHFEYSSEHSPLEFFVFALTDISFTKAGEDVKYLSFNENDISENTNLGDLFSKIHAELCEEKPYYLNMIRLYLEKLIIGLARIDGIGFKKISSLVPKSVSTCMQYINNNLNIKHSLEDLAKIGYVNKFYLVKQFKKELNITPLHYVADAKIKKAVEMLNTTDLSIEEIAEKLGYTNISHFYQQFKRVTNSTPFSYRKKG